MNSSGMLAHRYNEGIKKRRRSWSNCRPIPRGLLGGRPLPRHVAQALSCPSGNYHRIARSHAAPISALCLQRLARWSPRKTGVSRP